MPHWLNMRVGYLAAFIQPHSAHPSLPRCANATGGGNIEKESCRSRSPGMECECMWMHWDWKQYFFMGEWKCCWNCSAQKMVMVKKWIECWWWPSHFCWPQISNVWPVGRECVQSLGKNIMTHIFTKGRKRIGNQDIFRAVNFTLTWCSCKSQPFFSQAKVPPQHEQAEQGPQYGLRVNKWPILCGFDMQVTRCSWNEFCNHKKLRLWPFFPLFCLVKQCETASDLHLQISRCLGSL